MVLGALATHAQNYLPLLPVCNYKPGTLEYRQHFYNEIKKDSAYESQLLLFVNTALKNAGEDKNLNNGKPLESKHLWWITGQIYYGNVRLGKYESFINTRKLRSGKTEYYEDSIQKDFTAGTFKYKECSLTFLKGDCFNFITLPLSDQVNPEEAPQEPKVIYRDTVIYRYSYKELEDQKEEKRRADAAIAKHAQNMSGSTSSSSSWNHQSSESINQVDYSEGPGFTLDAAGIFRTVCQVAGIGNGSYQSNDVQGRALVSITPRKDLHVYSNSRSMSGGASSSNSTSFNLGGNAGNQNQNQQTQQQSTQGGYEDYNLRISGYEGPVLRFNLATTSQERRR